VTDQTIASADRAVSFGPFRLLPAQQLLLEGETPVRLGSRALEILIALVERAGELVSKNELMVRVWPDTFVDEGSIKVHVAGLRRALGDGQPGRRYLANVPGRGYRFVAPVILSEPEGQPVQRSAVSARTHNLPVFQSRAVGRAEVIGSLLDLLPRQRFITLVGGGGIGKTTVALALAEALLPAYGDGVRFVDLAPVNDPQYVPNALGTTLGLAVHSEDTIPLLIDFLRDKQMLVVLDSCEHAVEAAAALAERLLAEVPGVHILATSREPLRAAGERVHRLTPLDCPAASSDVTAAKALAFPAVRLFVERAAEIVDEFELSDADAPVVADICRKLGGVALAIELAAARVDAFGVQQLSSLLDDRFRILNKGRRTAQPRHRSLDAALDWSYEFLPEVERVTLRRLSVFVGGFTLESAVALAGDDAADFVEALANLVAKSLVSADVGGSIAQYRLLDTTRAYAMQKLTESGELQDYARRHAVHHLDWCKQAEAEWGTRSSSEWLDDYGRRTDDVRSALNWAFSPNGDAAAGVALTVASIPLWLVLSLLHECRQRIEQALTGLAAQPTRSERDELNLLEVLGLLLPHTTRVLSESDDFWTKSLSLAEKLGDAEGQGQMLHHWCVYRFYMGDFRRALTLAEKARAIADKGDYAYLGMMSGGMIGQVLHLLGDHSRARRYIDPIVNLPIPPNQNLYFAHRLMTRSPLANILWLRGFPDQAVDCTRLALEEARRINNALTLSDVLTRAGQIPLYIGDLSEAERSIETLLDCSAKHALTTHNTLGRCLKGTLLLAQGDFTGLAILRAALDRLREAGFAFHYTVFLGTLAQGLGAVGQIPEARMAIDQALERVESNEERWCIAELLRIKGEIFRLNESADADRAAEDNFQQSLDWARRQESLSWELRAAMSLAKLWHQNGKTAEADELLSAVYNRFTEGFDTADLRTARALIDELRKTPAPT
jgi:predicted ATPase/DNA-binding winged helix-turn-helix (wHTH) protein